MTSMALVLDGGPSPIAQYWADVGSMSLDIECLGYTDQALCQHGTDIPASESALVIAASDVPRSRDRSD